MNLRVNRKQIQNKLIENTNLNGLWDEVITKFINSMKLGCKNTYCEDCYMNDSEKNCIFDTNVADFDEIEEPAVRRLFERFLEQAGVYELTNR